MNVLAYLGLDNPAEVEDILKNLITSEKKTNEFQKIRQLLGKSAVVSDVRSRNSRKIAVEVASNLNILWVLQAAAIQGDPEIRTTAVRYTYQLWQRDLTRGFEILDYLAENATADLLPNFTAIESAFGLSALIFFEYSRDEPMLERLQSIWRKMIANILRIQEGRKRREKVIRRFIRERIVSFVITIALRYLQELPAYNVVSYEGLEAFFQLGATEKSLYRNLVQYLDVQGSYSIEQMEDDYLKAIKINNLLFKLVTVMGLTVHAYRAPIAFLPYLKKLFEEAKSNVVAYPYLTDITKVLENVLDHDPMIDDVFEFFVYTVEVCQEFYARYPQTLPNSTNEAPEASYLGPYAVYQYRRTGTARTEWLQTRIQKALSQNNLTFFNLMLTTELPLIGIEQEKPLIALDVLALFFQRSNSDIYRMIKSFLARLRGHFPDEVDDFLEEQHASDDFRLQVQTNKPLETIGGLIGQRSWYFLRDDVLVNSSHLQSKFMEILVKAADCKHPKEWLNYFLREIINLIYGEEALRQSA